VLREGPLHAAVKALLIVPGDRVEVPVGRFVIDLVRADGELVEVQTGNFGPLGRKLDALLDEHRMRIVHPIPAQRRILRVDEHGQVLGARRSPKRATAAAVFDKLVAFPSLLAHPNLTIEIVLTREDRLRRPTPTPARLRTSDLGERRLVDVLDRIELREIADLLGILPPLPSEPFTTRELAALLQGDTLLAQRTLYCLRTAGMPGRPASAVAPRCTHEPAERRLSFARDGVGFAVRCGPRPPSCCSPSCIRRPFRSKRWRARGCSTGWTPGDGAG